MKSFKMVLNSLLLSLALMGSALAADEKVNINTADAATLDRVLLNVGAFKSPDQLAMVKGIGLKTVEKNRDRIVVSGGTAPAKAAAKTTAAAKPAVKR